MSIKRSTPEEVRVVGDLIARTERLILALRQAGKNVHFIWDIDYVLASGRSDDVCALLKFDLVKFFDYEQRLILQKLETGPWLNLARKCGELQHSQDVVTARSSFLAMRAMFLVINERIEVNRQLFVGHQSKAESYRIILETVLADPNKFVFMVDDGQKHVDAFNDVALEMGLSERCFAILSPQLRNYDEGELQQEIEAVFAVMGKPGYVRIPPFEPNGYPRTILVTPDLTKTFRDIFLELSP